MQTVHKFSLQEVKELLRKTHNIPKTDEIEVEDVQRTTITYPMSPNTTHIWPYQPPYNYPTPSNPVFPHVWC